MAIRTALVCVASRQKRRLGCHDTCFCVISDRLREKDLPVNGATRENIVVFVLAGGGEC